MTIDYLHSRLVGIVNEFIISNFSVFYFLSYLKKNHLFKYCIPGGETRFLILIFHGQIYREFFALIFMVRLQFNIWKFKNHNFFKPKFLIIISKLSEWIWWKYSSFDHVCTQHCMYLQHKSMGKIRIDFLTFRLTPYIVENEKEEEEVSKWLVLCVEARARENNTKMQMERERERNQLREMLKYFFSCVYV